MMVLNGGMMPSTFLERFTERRGFVSNCIASIRGQG